MRGDEESTRTYQRTIRQWMAGALRRRMPGGPAGREVLDRFDAVVAEVVDGLRRDVGEDGAPCCSRTARCSGCGRPSGATDLATVETRMGRPHTLHNTGMIVLD